MGGASSPSSCGGSGEPSEFFLNISSAYFRAGRPNGERVTSPSCVDICRSRLYRANRTAMNIIRATHRFEQWLGRHTPLVKPDLRLKHQRMAEAVFPFLRATFYRWMQIWPEVCPDLAKAPRVLAVGDLRVENFGTWRDIEGRLVWGINDFDEAAVLPYTIDLVRLATSAILAIEDGHLALKPKDACASILEGYKESLAGARPHLSDSSARGRLRKSRAHSCGRHRALPRRPGCSRSQSAHAFFSLLGH